MSDPNAGKYQKLCRDDFKLAAEILAGRNGALDWSEHDYQAFTYRETGVCLVFYLHKTSAGNYHVRVRNQGSKDQKLAKVLMTELDKGSGFNCTFSQNNQGYKR
ncbi:MAG: hypothetical protein V7756_12890 [Halopseudomonas sp.]|uniref:hypothetical protein n=1 Tax=Halopseudomonas sp. TaxID=2901191 RepID=UPI003001CA6D